MKFKIHDRVKIKRGVFKGQITSIVSITNIPADRGEWYAVEFCDGSMMGCNSEDLQLIHRPVFDTPPEWINTNSWFCCGYHKIELDDFVKHGDELYDMLYAELQGWGINYE